MGRSRQAHFVSMRPIISSHCVLALQPLIVFPPRKSREYNGGEETLPCRCAIIFARLSTM
jgi:hypothetical protein